ncbi:hypothetical protein BK651_23205 [Pseudomonas rhodesiae]|nr:hypothetical protein BK650_19645 [Pseudomonas rhodesiae]ROM61388.1 hypothetical protein BK651_23205 [Pseudomonas rhodesiae]
MLLSKHEQAISECQLTACLTQACGIGQAEIVGFVWLTHQVDCYNFPSRLMVTWVFDTQTNRERTLSNGQGERMAQLTAEAFSEAGISVSAVSAHLAFDSEEQCQHVNAGNWQKRLERNYRARNYSVAKDIENPCISVCQLSGELCLSCGRTKEDIRKWKRMKRPEKIAAVERATLRLKNLQKKHPGQC